jgi:Rieske 2Fe-2S family protein
MDLMDDADTMSLDGSGGPPVPGLTGELTRKVCYFVLPPNLLISTHPDYVMTHRLTALTASQTHVECAWLFPDEVIAAAGFDPSYAANFWDITNRQDFSACESVTRGLRSRGYRPGPFDEREDGVRAFQEQLARLYRTDRWDRPRGAEMGKSALTAPGG